ncbi:hypothetical protein AX17_004733 [Amanita inopinata Kibby_2008]|nr:hypothetical protein AX17_004733 [Amanita inopinata Kibby_2008]
MVTYTISNRAYLKIFFHIAKHPHKPVNGVMLGRTMGDDAIAIEDAVPLLHHWTSLSPMMEIGLDLAGQYAESVDLKLVGYYQACERLDDTALAPVGENVAERIRASFDKAIAFVVDGKLVDAPHPALIPYIPSSDVGLWKRHGESSTAFTTNSLFQLVDNNIPSRAASFVRNDHLHQAFGDFDDHLEDVTIDWLRNTVCLPSDI